MKSKVVLVAILFCCLGAFFIQISLSHQVIVAKPTEETVRQVNQTEIEPAPEKAEKATSEKPMAKKTVNDYAPNNLIPLAVGNKWVYAWSSAFISEGESTESSKSLYHCWMSYGYKGLGVMASAYHYNALEHEETYEIVRQDGDHFFFEVSTEPKVDLSQIRDGRYEHGVELCWTWWDNRSQSEGSVGLTESIKREWGIHADYLLDGGLPPADKFDLPADHRDILRIEFEGETWGNSWVEILRVGDMHSIKCQPAQLNPIQVPAGIFKNCIESVEIFSGEFGDKKEEWETHIFWAPNVGRVYEYQILPDGTITYELKLLQYESN